MRFERLGCTNITMGLKPKLFYYKENTGIEHPFEGLGDIEKDAGAANDILSEL